MDAICSHHIFCIGDATIPYARLSALCLEAQCPRRLRDNFQIYVHLDGLRQDPQRAAEWFRRSSRTEVTTGLFGIHPDAYVPGKWHQAMVNTVSTEFSQAPVVAFVDADCFVTDSSWFLTAQLHDPTRHYRDQLVAYLAQQAQAAPAHRQPHAVGPAAPLRLVRRGTA